MSILDEFEKSLSTGFANITPHYFKKLICEFFNDSDYQVRPTRFIDDFGADILLRKGDLRIAVRVKKSTRGNLVQEEEISQVIEGRKHHKCNKALLITTSEFAEDARKLAEQTDVELWNLDKLCREINKIYGVPRRLNPCSEAIKKAHVLDSLGSPKRIEAFEKALNLALTEKGREEIRKDMIGKGLIADDAEMAVNQRIIDLMNDLVHLYEGAERFSEAESIRQRIQGVDGKSEAKTDSMFKRHSMVYRKCQINLVEIYASYELKKGKGHPRILINGSSLTVENYVKKVFENKGYTVVRGRDLNAFFRFCCGRWTGYIPEEKFGALNNRNRSICDNGMISEQSDTMIDNAHYMWKSYELNNPTKLALAIKLYKSLKSFEKNEIIGLLKMYSQSYGPEIDLFVFNNKTRDRQFVEVKSRTDSIRYSQLRFSFEIGKLGKNLFTFIYVLPSNAKELDETRDKTRMLKVHLDRAAEDLRKLYKIGADKVHRAYEKNKDIDVLAQSDHGVNPNCLLFFLKKTKNVCMDIDYDERKLWGGDKYFGMKEYLSRLESEWHELRALGLLLIENEPDKSNKIMEKLDKETGREKLMVTSKETHLCPNCWLSGDCDREKKAKKSREIITDCRGYFPKNK